MNNSNKKNRQLKKAIKKWHMHVIMLAGGMAGGVAISLAVRLDQ